MVFSRGDQVEFRSDLVLETPPWRKAPVTTGGRWRYRGTAAIVGHRWVHVILENGAGPFRVAPRALTPVTFDEVQDFKRLIAKRRKRP